MRGADALLSAVGTATQAPRGLAARVAWAAKAVVGKVIGSPEQYTTRVLGVVMLGTLVAAVLSAFLLTGDLTADSSAGPFVRFLVRSVAANWWMWAVITLLAVVAAWYLRWHLFAKATARETRFSLHAVKRLGYETRSTDGTTPLYGDTTHTKDQLKGKLLRAFSGSEHVETTRDLSADDLKSPGALAAEAGPAGALEAEPEPEPEAPEGADLDPDLAADLAGGMAVAEIVVGATGWDPNRGPDADADSDDAEDASAEEPSTLSSLGGRARSPLAVWRLELASALNLDELVWRFAFPAVLSAYFMFALAQTFWLRPLGYVMVASVSVFIGTVSFAVFKVLRRRRLSAVRETSETKRWPQAVALAKRIDVRDGPTGYYVRMGGRDYFHFDKVRLAEKVADRWHQRIHGDTVAPAFEEKCARNVRQMLPTLHQFEYKDGHEGRAAIMDDLVDEVRTSADPDGIVPKRTLCERVVRRGDGIGHDPDLVAECYQELVPTALYETPVTLEDTDGNEQTVVCVHLRSQVIPDDLSQIRAQFSREFSADDTATYDLPAIPQDALHDPALMVPGTPARHLAAD